MAENSLLLTKQVQPKPSLYYQHYITQHPVKLLVVILCPFSHPSLHELLSNIYAPHTPLPPPFWGGSRRGFVDVSSPSLSTPGSRASTASAAAVLTSSSSSRPRHHKSLSTSAHPNSPDLHAHRPRQVAAQLPCWSWSQRADLLKTQGSSHNKDDLILYYFTDCLCFNVRMLKEKCLKVFTPKHLSLRTPFMSSPSSKLACFFFSVLL